MKDIIARVRELDQKATKGPWRESKLSSIRVVAELSDGTGRYPVAYTGEALGTGSGMLAPEACANNDLIAEYRTAAPALADECERLLEKVEKARRAIETAPHDETCERTRDPYGATQCTCWKSRALEQP